MNLEQVKEIANAVLYEGYLLYPYRQSSVKNRQRWTFGGVYPQKYSEAHGGDTESWTMHTECLVTGQANTSLDVTVRFLHLLVRTVMPSEHGNQTSTEFGAASKWSMISPQAPEPWEEGIERELSTLGLSLGELVAHPRRVEIAFPAQRLREHDEKSAAAIVREQFPIAGTIIIAAEPVSPTLFKLSVHIENTTPEIGMATDRRDAALLQSFVSTHTLLKVQQGAFVSLLEPPEALQATAQACQNRHTWPVMVGDEGDCDMMLSSPIILYDYPQIAPESLGPLFDGTEIDEILILRILTLSEEEKQELRQGDPHGREILERAEALSPEEFMKLHGVIRGMRPIDEGGIV